MPQQFSKQELLSALQSTVARAGSPSAINFRGVEFDTRAIKGGELFIALPGEQTHGHAFLERAFEAGAALALVEDEKLLDGPFRERLIYCENTLEGFWVPARLHRRQLTGKVLGVTGSMGKTTTKEIAATLLQAISPGTYSKKSFNNHLGVPYTLCQASTTDEWILLEMGMNHSGELHNLSLLARPDVVAITVIAPVHIEFFDSVSGIADAKVEIFDGLSTTGVGIVNGDDEELTTALKRNPSVTGKKLISFGSSGDAVITGITSDPSAGVSFTLTIGGETEHFTIKLFGRHNASLATAAILATRAVYPSLPLKDLNAPLLAVQPPAMRLNLIALEDGRQLIDDSYNANPTAMKAALGILKEFQDGGLRVAAILGEMRELGSWSEHYHRELGTFAAELKLEFLLTVGDFTRFTTEEAVRGGLNAIHCASPEEAAEIAYKRPFDVLLIKASRGVKLDLAVKKLREYRGDPQVSPG